ncbi:MAG: dockerin type I repeat-containing protein [Ruminococcus sp.]|nr:dockerin type I repeat-containing protein [Ruminococcus sp.]
MRIIKKIIPLFITISLLISCIFSADAKTTEEELFDDFVVYCEEKLNIKYDPENPLESSIIIYSYYETPDATFFCGNGSSPILLMEYSENIGNWYFVSPVIFSPGGLGLFVRSKGEIYTLREAYNSGVITDLSPTLHLTDIINYEIYPNGDANGDETVNIKDATTIQKYLVGIDTTLAEVQDVRILMDTNTDGTVNIKDATTIQKKLTNLE